MVLYIYVCVCECIPYGMERYDISKTIMWFIKIVVKTIYFQLWLWICLQPLPTSGFSLAFLYLLFPLWLKLNNSFSFRACDIAILLQSSVSWSYFTTLFPAMTWEVKLFSLSKNTFLQLDSCLIFCFLNQLSCPVGFFRLRFIFHLTFIKCSDFPYYFRILLVLYFTAIMVYI